MAKVIDNPKGFKVIEMSLTEVNKALGGYGICDYCGEASFTGYYIAVLNAWYCPDCYKKWIERAIRYEADARIEANNFEYAGQRLDRFCQCKI